METKIRNNNVKKLSMIVVFIFMFVMLLGVSSNETYETKVDVKYDSTRQMGDMNGDGKITAADVALLYRYVRGNKTVIDSEAIKVADLSGDGEITVADVSLLYRKLRSITNDDSGSKDDTKDDGTKDDNVSDQSSAFSKDSWGTIIGNVRAENTDQYKVGDTKEIDLGTLGKHTLRIANKSNPAECKTDSKTFSQTACGFVVEFADIIELKKIVDGNYTRYLCYDYKEQQRCGDMYFTGTVYPKNSLSDYINYRLYNAIIIAEPMLKKGIMNTKVSWDDKNSTYYTHGFKIEIPEATTRYVYLLSLREIYNVSMSPKERSDGTWSYPSVSSMNETRQLDYYKSVGVTASMFNNGTVDTITNEKNVIKKYNGTATAWWTRSMNYDGGFYKVEEDGNIPIIGSWGNFVNQEEYGVSPAFRIAE